LTDRFEFYSGNQKSNRKKEKENEQHLKSKSNVQFDVPSQLVLIRLDGVINF